MVQNTKRALLFVVILWLGTPVHANYNAVLDRIINSYLNSRPASDLDINYRNLLNSATQRDEEYLPENTLWGYQYISDGSGEQHLTPQGIKKQSLSCNTTSFHSNLCTSGSGEQHLTPQGKEKMTTQQEVKSDKNLPAYCNPPNPCPIGYTELDGCITNFENSAENNRKYQAAQDCPCDADHMFSCPAGSKVINTKSRKATASLGSGVAHALGDQESNEKRHSVVAKKSPQPAFPEQAQFDDFNERFDETGPRRRIAKKSPYA